MALRDALRGLFSTSPLMRTFTFDEGFASQVLGLPAETLWRTQPHLRTVVGFVARNIAHLGLHTFERVDEDDRRRLRTDPVALTLARPNPAMTTYELVYGLVADLKLYDVAVWSIVPSVDADSGWELYPISPSWITSTGGGTAWAPEWVEVFRPGAPRPVKFDAKDLLIFHGWNPGQPAGWSSPVEALRGVLAEQIHANAYRQQVWQRGGRVGAVLTRPANAPSWGDAARERFARDWKAKWTGDDGPKAGGTPILEDGMTLDRVRFSAKEEEWIDGAKLSLSTVAQVYHVNPTMVGLLDNANYSNVREFRRSLYGDTLGPDIAMIEDRLNTFLVPRLTAKRGVYVEFNLAEKLQGSFEEQAAVLSTSVGRPWMTADEARARQNLPGLGGDAGHLVTPLNVLVGGQASPQDGTTAGGGGSLPVPAADIKVLVDAAAALIRSGFSPEGALEAVGLDPIDHLGLLPVTVQRPEAPENPDTDAVEALKSALVALTPSGRRKAVDGAPARRVKAVAPETHVAKAEQVLVEFLRVQRRGVMGALGSKADGEWWDRAKWDRELADRLFALAVQTSTEVGQKAAESLGFDAGDYDIDRTLAFLKAVAESRAGMVNETTRQAIEDALGSDDPDVTPAAVFADAEKVRAPVSATTLVTTFAAFATTEAGKHVAGDRARKTWDVNSDNPRSSHAAMNGQTVGIDAKFSNGMAWPGDPAGGADEVAGCLCGVTVTVE